MDEIEKEIEEILEYPTKDILREMLKYSKMGNGQPMASFVRRKLKPKWHDELFSKLTSTEILNCFNDTGKSTIRNHTGGSWDMLCDYEVTVTFVTCKHCGSIEEYTEDDYGDLKKHIEKCESIKKIINGCNSVDGFKVKIK